MSDFGQRLRYIRLEKRMTQEQLGELCSTSATAVRNLEKGRSKPSYGLLVLLCNALKVSPGYLLQDDLEFDNKDMHNAVDTLTAQQLDMLSDIISAIKQHS